MEHEQDRPPDAQDNSSAKNSPAECLRLFESLRGLLKEEFAEYGGGEAFIRWMRSDDEVQNRGTD